MKVKTKKPLRCGKCGHLIGNVRVRPAFKRKLLMYGLLIALGFQIVAEAFMEFVKWLL